MKKLSIDMTPTWGEVGVMVERMYRSNEQKALSSMRGEIRKAFAMAQGFKQLMECKEMPDAMRELGNEVAAFELAKQEKAGGPA